MTSRSFAITTARDFYNKLLEDYAAFEEDTTSSRLAINCAMTAWHLAEWVYWDNRSTLLSEYPQAEPYLIELRTIHCVELEIMRGITNGSKHFSPPGSSQKVQGSGLHEGVFSSAFSSEFDTSYLFITLDDGNELSFEDTLDRVLTFWANYLTSTFGWIL